MKPRKQLRRLSIHALRAKLTRARTERGTLPDDAVGRRRALKRAEARVLDELKRRGLDP